MDIHRKRELRQVGFSRHLGHGSQSSRPAVQPKQPSVHARSARKRTSTARRIFNLFVLLGIASVCGIIVFLGYRSYKAVSSIIVSNSRSGKLPIISAESMDSLPIINWKKKKERINILVIGLDRWPRESAELARTDTNILVSINPEDRSVVMISIPRDLEVPYEQNGYTQYIKINAVHVYGGLNGAKGSGPAAVKQSVSDLLGIPIHYFVRVDFQGFRSLVDTIGGITVKVDKQLYDYEYPDEGTGYDPVKIEAGEQVMDGQTALKYARSRHSTDPAQASDLDRAARQQKVLIAIKEKMIATKWDLITDPVKLSKLLDTLKDYVLTDIRIEEMLQLADLAKEIDTSNSRKVVSVVLGAPYIYHEERAGKDWRFYPRDPIFQDIHTFVSETLDNPFLAQDIAAEGAFVRIENGTTSSGLASNLSLLLRTSYGMKMDTSRSAGRTDYTATEIQVINNSEFPATQAFLERYLGVVSYVPSELTAGEKADIIVIVGSDFVPK